MNRLVSVLFVSAFVTLASFTVSGQAPDKLRKGFLGVLSEGQSCVVKEVGGRFEITMMKDVKLGQKVIEVGNDFIVVEDIAGVTESRIHVTSIKAIVKIKMPKE